MKLYKDEIRDVYEALMAYRRDLVVQLDNIQCMKNVPYNVIATYNMKMGSLTRIIKRFEEHNRT
jgi:hypothetical protein